MASKTLQDLVASLSFTNLQKTLPFAQPALGLNTPSTVHCLLCQECFPPPRSPMAPLSFPSSLCLHTTLSVRLSLKNLFKIEVPSPSPNALHHDFALFFSIAFVTIWYLISLYLFFFFTFYCIALLLYVSSLRKGTLSVLYTLVSPLPRKMPGT